MAKRRTSGIQRRRRASADALNRRLDAPRGSAIDWRIVAIVGFLGVGLVAVIVSLVVASTPNPWEGVRQSEDGRDHVAVGTDVRTSQPGTYSTTPATSGPHWDTAGIAQWGAYLSPRPESQLVHNLEHGGIVIWYQPDQLDADAIDRLNAFVVNQVSTGLGGRFKFIVSPWSGEDFGSPIAVTAWRQLLYLDEANLDAIRGFADANYQDAPENNGGPAPVANPAPMP